LQPISSVNILKEMKKKGLTLILILFLTSLLFPSKVEAAKKRLRRRRKRAGVSRTYSRTRGVKTTVRFRPDRRGLILRFIDFGQAVSVTYTLTYQANGIPQGATGKATPATAGQPRELLFGTCSGGVCRYHQNITQARLVIDSRLSSGLIIRKPYRIKI